MQKITHFCDVCKKEVLEKKDLKTITIGNGGDWISYSSCNHFIVYKKYDMCQSCQEKIGLHFPNEIKKEEKELVQDRLFDIVSEIVSMNMPSN